jgi:rhodanese-related sulfurtransferase
MQWKAILSEVVLLLFAAAVAAIGSNLVRPESEKLAWIGSYSTPRSVRPGEIQGQSKSHGSTVTPVASPLTKRLLAIAPAKNPGLLFLQISGDVVHKLHEAGAMFIDARRSADYEAGHIAGARSIPVWEHEADARVSALQAEGVLPDQVIVVYCSGIRCDDSAQLAEKLAFAGFFNVYVYAGGFPDWQFADGPVRQGKNP